MGTRDGPDRIPTIALTAYARAEDHERAFTAGFHDVAKPVEPQQRLIDLVSEMLSVKENK